MKIGVIGDTHDHIDTFDKAAQVFKEHKVGLVVHHGDWVMPSTVEGFVTAMHAALPGVPIKGILGNNDGEVYNILRRIRDNRIDIQLEKEFLELDVENRKIAVYHGTEEKIVNALLRSGLYDAVFRGHTHVAGTEQVGSALHLNAGTTSFISRGRSVAEATVAVYDTGANEAHIISFS